MQKGIWLLSVRLSAPRMADDVNRCRCLTRPSSNCQEAVHDPAATGRLVPDGCRRARLYYGLHDLIYSRLGSGLFTQVIGIRPLKLASIDDGRLRGQVRWRQQQRARRCSPPGSRQFVRVASRWAPSHLSRNRLDADGEPSRRRAALSYRASIPGVLNRFAYPSTTSLCAHNCVGHASSRPIGFCEFDPKGGRTSPGGCA